MINGTLDIFTVFNPLKCQMFPNELDINNCNLIGLNFLFWSLFLFENIWKCNIQLHPLIIHTSSEYYFFLTRGQSF